MTAKKTVPKTARKAAPPAARKPNLILFGIDSLRTEEARIDKVLTAGGGRTE